MKVRLPKYEIKEIRGGIGEFIIAVEVRVPEKKYSLKYSKDIIEAKIRKEIKDSETTNKLYALKGRVEKQ